MQNKIHIAKGKCEIHSAHRECESDETGKTQAVRFRWKNNASRVS
jgi:hypothetical protein